MKKFVSSIVLFTLIFAFPLQSFARIAPECIFKATDWDDIVSFRKAIETNNEEEIQAFAQKCSSTYPFDPKQLLKSTDEQYIALPKRTPNRKEIKLSWNTDTEYYSEYSCWIDINCYYQSDDSVWRFHTHYTELYTGREFIDKSEEPAYVLKTTDGQPIEFYFIRDGMYSAEFDIERGKILLDLIKESGNGNEPPLEQIGKIEIQKFSELTAVPKFPWTIVITSICGGVLLGGGVVTFLLLRKRKRKQKIAEES